MNNVYLKFLTLSVLIILVTGCGDGKVAVTGSISYKEAVPDTGTIAFIGDNGAGASYGGPYTNGQYSIRVPEGTYLVRITGWKTVTLDKPIVSNMGRPTITTRDEMIVPAEYGNLSKLQAEVKASVRTLDFHLPTSE